MMVRKTRCVLMTLLVLAALLGLAVTSLAAGPVGGAFAISELEHEQVQPSVAYNPQRQEYLVVWHNEWPGNKDIYGRRLSKDGTALGSWFAISHGPGDRYFADVAYNQQRNEYLVVWEHYEGYVSRVRARRVSATGELLGGEITLSPPPGPGSQQMRPAVAYASTSDLYLVVMEYKWEFGIDIVAQSLSSAGALVGGLQGISGASGTMDNREQPDVAYNRRRNEFLVVWQQMDTTYGDYDIYARRVLGDGTPAFPESIEVTRWTSDDLVPAVAAIPTEGRNGQYLVTWEHREGTNNGDVMVRRFDGDGSALSGVERLLPTSTEQTKPAVAGNESTRQYLVAWSHATSPPFVFVGVRATLLSTGGAVVGDATFLGGVFAYNAAAASGPLGDFLVAYDDMTPGIGRDIWGRLWGNRVYLPVVVRSRQM